jgi:hypothetical protein
MCKQEFEEKALDFLGRCESCFRKYMELPDTEKPNLGIPFTPVSKAVK